MFCSTMMSPESTRSSNPVAQPQRIPGGARPVALFRRRAVVVRFPGRDLAQCAGVDAAHQFDEGRRRADLKSHIETEPPLRLLADLEHALGPGHVHRHGFLEIDVLARRHRRRADVRDGSTPGWRSPPRPLPSIRPSAGRRAAPRRSATRRRSLWIRRGLSKRCLALSIWSWNMSASAISARSVFWTMLLAWVRRAGRNPAGPRAPPNWPRCRAPGAASRMVNAPTAAARLLFRNARRSAFVFHRAHP